MTATDTYLGLRAFCDELARSGVTDAVTSPGSRSTPLVLSLAREPGLRAHSVIDERAAGFFALGLAKASGAPAVLACTSGTAAANYLPAVVEAYEARVPMIVLTADRPPELREIGAGQAIDQVKLYGRAAKWYLEVDDAEATPARVRWLRQLACRVALLTTSGTPGPVHLNFALREPLVLDAPLPAQEPGGGGRPGGAPWLDARDEDAEPFDGARRPLLVVGGPAGDGTGALAAAAAGDGIPLLADPLSWERRGPAAIAHYDAILRDPAKAAELRPDAVLRVGDLPVSKPLRQFLAGLDVPQWAVTGPEDLKDPEGAVCHLLPFGADLHAHPEAGWLDAWRAADGALPAARDVWAAGLTEPLVADRAYAALGADDTLVVAASMPVRDLETFAPVREDPPRVLANRGANGIDGTIATALGVAAASPGARTLLWLGDVALAHDLAGLAAARRLPADLAVLVVDNGGGGIFDFLPVAKEGEDFVRHVTTATGLDPAEAARVAGFRHTLVTDAAQLDGALADALSGGFALVEVRTDREANVALHRATWAAVSKSFTR